MTQLECRIRGGYKLWVCISTCQGKILPPSSAAAREHRAGCPFLEAVRAKGRRELIQLRTGLTIGGTSGGFKSSSLEDPKGRRAKKILLISECGYKIAAGSYY